MNKFMLIRALLGLVLLTGTLLPAAGDTTWRGQAGVSAGAGLPETGLFAATNEFPRGTLLEVRNLRNNKTLQLQVLKRSPSALDLNFIYLSTQAGRDLDIRSGESVLVSVSVLQSATVIPTPTVPVASSLTAPEGNLKPLTSLSLENRNGEPVVPVLASLDDTPATVPTPPDSGQVSTEGLDQPPVVPGSLDNPRPREVSPGTPVAAAGDTSLPLDKPSGLTSPTEVVPPAAPATEDSPAVIALNEPALEDLLPLEKPEVPGVPSGNLLPESVVAAKPDTDPSFPLDSPALPPAAAENVRPDTVAASDPGSDPSLVLDAPAVTLLPPATAPADPAVTVAMNSTDAGEDLKGSPTDLPSPPVMAERPYTVTAQALPGEGTPWTEEAPEFSVEAALAFMEKKAPAVAMTPEVPESVAAVQPSAAGDPVLPLAVPSVAPVPETTAPVVAAATSRPAATPSELEKLGVRTLPRETPQRVPQRSTTGDVYVSRPAPVTEDPLGDVKLVTRLEGTGDYIQLASYRSQDSVIKTLEKINSYIPLVLWVPEGTTPVYRLVAGPLRRDQLGLVFKHYQDQGFRDAFIIRKP